MDCLCLYTIFFIIILFPKLNLRDIFVIISSYKTLEIPYLSHFSEDE